MKKIGKMSCDIMNKDIMVSIVMAVYNHRDYILQAIESVLMQETDFNMEVWLGEDCSPDNSREVIEQILPQLPEWFHVIFRDKNIGAAANFSDLYKHINGKYFIVLEGDDYWTSKTKLQQQVDFLEKNTDYIAVAHRCIVVDEHGNEIPNDSYPDCRHSEYTVFDYEKGILPGQTATVLKRNYYKYDFFPLFMNKTSFPGDRKNAFLLASWGRVYCMQEELSAYRHVTSHGTSYSAVFINNAESRIKNYNFHRELYIYANTNSVPKSSKAVAEALYFFFALHERMKKEIGSKELINAIDLFIHSKNKLHIAWFLCYKLFSDMNRRIASTINRVNTFK